MCGIAGYYGRPAGDFRRNDLLSAMIGAVGHRGPDDSGVFFDDHVGLAHARLSIIDLNSGHQPMTDTDEALWVTFNGEIFNYIELRDDLKARGYVFRTQSDTEVLLHLYAAHGPEFVNLLNGDFAFAIWDSRARRLMLARDRMGVRPLYYTQRKDGFYFGSEVKALDAVPGFTAELDPLALDQIFTFWFPLAPRTPFKDVCELPPAHMMLVDDNGITVRPYWQLDYPDAAESQAEEVRSEADFTRELRELLMDSVRIRLRADVPVGAYLSGGLDSSIITASINEISPQHLRSFSVAFESAEFDESEFQNQMVSALGTRHSTITCRSSDIGDMFPAVIQATERPIVRTGPAPLYALSGHVRDAGMKVVMTGEGADEVFAGYDIFKETKIRRFCARDPQSTRRPKLFQRLYGYLPGLQAQSQSYLESFFNTGGGGVDDPLFSHLPRFNTTAGAKIFFSQDLKQTLNGYDAVDDLRSQLPADFGRWHPLSQAQYLETAHLLPGYILSSQGDRVSMANAVEGRFPFLDHRLVEFASRIPPKLKLRGLREKHILREATRDLLPPAVANRPKQPYRAPDAPAFFGPSAPAYVAEVLSPSALSQSGTFNAAAVGKLAAKGARRGTLGFRDNTALVGILSSQLWHRRFVAGQSNATELSVNYA